MQEVKIYIETSLQGPAIKDGRYAASVEYISKSGSPITREVMGEEKDTTFHRSTLLAAVRALEILKRPCSVTIMTNCEFIERMAERGNSEAWKREEWEKPSGKKSGNKGLWKEFMEQMDRHEIEFRLCRNHEYKKILQQSLTRKG